MSRPKSFNTYYQHKNGYMVGITNNHEEFIFDNDDLTLMEKYKWYIHQGYVKTCIGRKQLGLHRLIFNIKDSKIQVDHINHNTSDNRKENLRVCTNQENQMNRGSRSDNTSGYKGVSWHKPLSKWRTAICYKGKVMHIGYYTNKEEAALAYNEAALKYFGEFALLNVI